MYEQFAKLLTENQVTAYQVSKATGVAQSSLSDWKKGKSKPKYEKLKKIADYFGVPVEWFLEQSAVQSPSSEQKRAMLTKKDERQIEKILEQTRLQLTTQQGLMFDGDPASPEAIQSILVAMELGLQAAKMKNKEKYTPNKFKQTR